MKVLTAVRAASKDEFVARLLDVVERHDGGKGDSGLLIDLDGMD